MPAATLADLMPPLPKVDARWFEARIRASRFGSQRQLAREMTTAKGGDLDPAQLSLILNGKRAMHLVQAVQLAELLEQPLLEVIERAGVAVRGGRGRCPACGRAR